MKHRTLFVLIIGLLLLVSHAAAQSYTEFTYQGSLKDGATPANANYDFAFALFDSPQGGDQVGSTITRNTVVVANGIFTVKLDFGPAFPGGANRYLEIRVRPAGAGTLTTLVPRQSVTAAPYSITALDATSSNIARLVAPSTSTGATGTPTINSGFITSAQVTNSGSGYETPPSVIINDATGAGAVITSNISGGSVTSLTVQSPGSNYSAGTTLSIVLPPSNASQTFITPNVFTGVNTMSNVNNTFAGSFTGNGAGLTDLNAASISSGTLGSARLPNPLTLSGTSATHIIRGENASTTNGAMGVFGMSTATSGGTYGGLFRSNSATGRGVYGLAASFSGVNYGGYFESVSTAGTGVFGNATSSTGTTHGVYGRSGSTSGGGGVLGYAESSSGDNYGVLGVTESVTGVGVFGIASNFDGVNYGVFGRTQSPNGGSGVYGVAERTSGFTFGGQFVSNSPDGRAVRGSNNATTGLAVAGRFATPSNAGISIWSSATSTTGITYGVFGEAVSASGYGLWAQGRTGASGTKSFRIDHPDDPTNKYLNHYSTESPEVLNAYSGKVTLDAAGEATIELPQYFAKINKDPRYTLTAVGAPMPMLHIALEIDENALIAGAKAGPGAAAQVCSFRIAGGVPGGKVSWRIEAVRNDLFVRQRGAPVTIEKQGTEKGTYQHPDLYNQPAEKGLNYEPARHETKPTHPTHNE